MLHHFNRLLPDMELPRQQQTGMVPIWATHMGHIWLLRTGSMWVHTHQAPCKFNYVYIAWVMAYTVHPWTMWTWYGQISQFGTDVGPIWALPRYSPCGPHIPLFAKWNLWYCGRHIDHSFSIGDRSDFIVLPDWETMTKYPTQLHYRDTETINSCPILIMLGAWLGIDKDQFYNSLVWFDSTGTWNPDLLHARPALYRFNHLPRSQKFRGR